MNDELKMNKKGFNIAQFIEHTNVGPTATTSDIRELCKEAKKYNFYAVCVSPGYVALAKKSLRKTNIAIVCVVGFPHGSSSTKTKVIEAVQAIHLGADEIDMCMNFSAFKNKDYDYVYNDINSVVKAVKGKKVKVIIEVGYLTKDEIKKAGLITKQAGAHFIKTCTGFGPRGVKKSDIILLRKILKENIGIKASGMVRSYAKAMSMIQAGAIRIGTSRGVKIMKAQNNN